ncbi:cea90484-42c4-45bf-bd30-2bca5e04d677-CDS [Sclerotinia trifoliorum]|uniref:Cea90484-42c4-45bf-bd30-2bca5e04d677-CDS n=1 Tax=Sclerotinia trifoliorum TaxID=28548 RepID=A0A8H2VWS4_9HELO|nr:cea90484-42c4-45bf-bd30-2bca5e04d677-CDS [Sclerotinia trifoliorum]
MTKMTVTHTKYSCGHVRKSQTPAERAKEEPSQGPKKILTRILSLGMADDSRASRTRTLHQPQPERLKQGLKRFFSLGRSEPIRLTSIEECSKCKESRANFTSDVLLGWVDELPELEGTPQPEEPDQQRSHTAQAVPQEFQTRREPTHMEESPQWRRQQARIPLDFIRNRTSVREKVQKEAERDETLAALEGRGQAPTLPYLQLGGYWDSEEERRDESLASFERRGRAPPARGIWVAEEEPLLQHERDPFKSDGDSI